MRVFKNAWFARFARKENISDASLWEAAARLARGQIDAKLGGEVFKQRIGRRGQGKSSGYRTIVLFRRGQFALFVYGFAKNCRDNICDAELAQFRKMAGAVLNLNNHQIGALISNGQFEEVNHDDQAI